MRCGGVFFPILMIVLGTIFLVQNVFPDLYWLRDVWRFWPVLLIIWGVSMLSRRAGMRGPWMRL